MRINKILDSRTIRFVRLTQEWGKTLFGKGLTNALENRYGFFEGPKMVKDFDIDNGITFLHGFFEEGVIIDRLQIYSNGVLAESKNGTDICENFIEDVVNWLGEEAKLNLEPLPLPPLYSSTLEVEITSKFGAAFFQFEKVSALLDSFFEGENRKFQVSGIQFQNAQDGSDRPFRLERRADQPFDSNLYFSNAPLATEKHARVLETIEQAVL
ncbi:hypothetical protein [Inquilinus sp. OTU3971]|uniref:hypothetical protein n=1 Tax=Inquilinus sp. OTU3971 TaxID=3043855 RepID=UPI00313EBC3D